MVSLPDPRPPAALPPRWASRLDALSESLARGDSERETRALSRLIQRALEAGEGAAVRELLRGAPPALAGQVARAADFALAGGDAAAATGIAGALFVLPVLLVAGGLAPAEIPGVVPDIGEIRILLRQAGALGPVENFGIGNALGTLEDASEVAPERLHALSRSLGEASGIELLPPRPIRLDSSEEQVHLRLLVGMSVTNAASPTFLETAGPVGRWGMSVSQALVRQLALPGLSLLALPRAPMPWYAALREAAFASEEIAFSLFATRTIRTIRAQTGDPVVTVSARRDGAIAVVFESPFDEQLRAEHRWPLRSADDLSRVEASILGLLKDCRIDRVEVSETLQPVALQS